MSFENETDRRRKPGPSSKADAGETTQPDKKRPAKPEFGNALRAAYRQAVEEDIPPEMLDLLGKLS